jgi:hypothetical protein
VVLSLSRCGAIDDAHEVDALEVGGTERTLFDAERPENLGIGPASAQAAYMPPRRGPASRSAARSDLNLSREAD